MEERQINLSLKTELMKSILFVAIMALGIAACDTPQTTTGTGTDTTTTTSPNTVTDTTTAKPDTTRQ
jgi:uncharacterized lipoprotein YajG